MSGVGGVSGAVRVVVSDGGDFAVQIANLRRQARVLNKNLKDVAASDADATTKASQQAVIAAKIAMIEAQIAQLQQQQQAQRSGRASSGPMLAISVEPTNRDVIKEFSGDVLDTAL